MTFFNKIPIKVLLLLGLLFSGLVPLCLVIVMSNNTAKHELKEQAFRQLESVRNIKKNQLELFFNEKITALHLFAQMPEMQRAFSSIHHPSDKIRFGEDFVHFMQYFAEKNSFSEVFVVEMGANKIQFSLWSKKLIAQSFRDLYPGQGEYLKQLMRTSGEALISDIGLDFGRQGQFMYMPVPDTSGVKAVIVAHIGTNVLDKIMQERSGMGKTGETYLVGYDLKMRSDSFLDPSGHSVKKSLIGSVRNNGVDTIATREALQGISNSKVIKDYNNNWVLSSYTPFSLYGLKWALVSEIDNDEIDQKISSSLTDNLILLVFISLALLMLISFVIFQVINKSIVSLVHELELLIKKVLKGDLSVRGNLSNVAVDFHGVVESTNKFIDSFVSQVEEKRLLQQRLEHNARMETIGRFTGRIAHDLNNILTYMYSYAELVLSELKNGSIAHKHMSEIIKAVDRATQLAGQILTFSKQNLSKEKHPVDLGKIAREVLNLLKANASKNIDFALTEDVQNLHVMGDSTQCHQIFMNLAKNALEAMKDQMRPGQLKIHLTALTLSKSNPCELPAGEYVKASIIDNGAGIDEVVRNRLFEPFFTTKSQGTGMGLAIVLGIVKNYQGAIQIDGKQGQGTCVDVYLPQKIMPASSDESVKGVEEKHFSFKKLFILFIDNESGICEATKKMLQGMGHKVDVATSGEEGLTLFVSENAYYDLVITDYHMPGANGVEVAQDMRSLRTDLPVIVITSYPDVVILEKDFFKEPKTKLLLKPYSKELLQKTIREIYN